MNDTELNTILAMRCTEYNEKVYQELMDRMTHMSDDPKALLKHFAHLVEVFNNHVWLIHVYREYISAINKELNSQCSSAKRSGVTLDTGSLNKIMDGFNKRLDEARKLCKSCEPDSFMKMGMFKITNLKQEYRELDESAELQKPDANDEPETIRHYLIFKYGWLRHGPKPVDFTYVGNNGAGHKLFCASARLGGKVYIEFNPCGDEMWVKNKNSRLLINGDGVKRELFMTLFDIPGKKDDA